MLSHYRGLVAAEQTRHRTRTLLPDLFESQGIPFHDVATIAAPSTTDRQLYLDYCHLTPEGSEVVAPASLRSAPAGKPRVSQETSFGFPDLVFVLRATKGIESAADYFFQVGWRLAVG